MALFVVRDGRREFLTSMLQNPDFDPIHLWLINTDFEYDPDLSIGTLGVETSCTPDTPILNQEDWTIDDTADPMTATQSTVSFVFPSSATIYGYAVVNSDSGYIKWVEKFDSPVEVPSGGGTLNLTPKITLGACS